MSTIGKTEAIVLNKINYGDTSIIASLFTNEFGRISAILKGGRSPKSKSGMAVDPPNHLHLVLYNKETREVQLISSVEILEHFPGIKSDLDALAFAFATVELIRKLTPEHEPNPRLFRGTAKILKLFEEGTEPSLVIFSRFFIFMLTELGYELVLSDCTSCGKKISDGEESGFNLGSGMLCSNCIIEHIESFHFNPELFNYLLCLKQGMKYPDYKKSVAEKGLVFLDRYLRFHVPDFTGIQSLKILNNIK